MGHLRGILYKVIAVSLFVAMAACIKATAEHVPPGERVFFRSFFAIPVILVWLWWIGDLAHGLRTDKPVSHLWRGLFGTSAMGMRFTALGLLPLIEVTAIAYAGPLLTVIAAALILGERIRGVRITAVSVGLIGVLIILWPRLTVLGSGGTAEALGAILVLLSALFVAFAHVFIRKLTATEHTGAITFYFAVMSASLSLLTLPFGWVWPTPGEWVLLVAAGVLGGVAQVFLTSSYRHAPASVVAPFEYVSMLIALGVGYAVFAEVPTTTMLIGAALVVSAGLVVLWRERQLGLRREAASAGQSQA
ncbi:MAG: DMT family transporter [Pseudomonadota bacterium]